MPGSCLVQNRGSCLAHAWFRHADHAWLMSSPDTRTIPGSCLVQTRAWLMCGPFLVQTTRMAHTRPVHTPDHAWLMPDPDIRMAYT